LIKKESDNKSNLLALNKNANISKLSVPEIHKIETKGKKELFRKFFGENE
jgi:hypothetical protein